jgi:hypothetical protein
MEDKERGLPPELMEALKDSGAAQMKHNWAYSFMMANDEIYLVGYCKVCDTSFASIVDHNKYTTTLTDAQVPKWGCVPKD